jgi:hypothetical protein
MSPNLTELLYTICPNSYKELSKHYDFEFSDGWFGIMVVFSLKLEELINKEKGLKAYIAQAKEKFGSCQIYLTNGTNEMHVLSREITEKSQKVCEYCGCEDKTVITSGPGWYKTLCSECRTKRNNNKLKF